MTTIACNRESMAGDSQVSWDFHKGYSCPKIFRIGTSIYGIAGDNFGNVFIEWAQEGFKTKAKPAIWSLSNFELIDFDVLELAPDGIWLWDKHLVRMGVKDDSFSIGSGSKFALVFMRKMALTPEQAVLECCEFDDYTRGPVDVMYLNQAKEAASGPTTKA